MNQTTIIPGAVIFDMDGLMLDTERPAIDLWPVAARKFGWEISPEIIFRTVGVDEASIRAVFLEEYGPSFPYEDVCGELVHLIHDRIAQEGIAHRPGLLILLDHLARLNIPLGVATSTKRTSAIQKLKQTGILDRFSILTCGDEVLQGKPAPDIFLLAAERLGAKPGNCVGFEDSSAGLRSLHAAGIPSVFVMDLIEPPPEVLATVWRCCADLAEAATLFG